MEYIVTDVLGHIEGVTARRMFGGYGLYLDGRIFGIITSDADLYFKVDETNRATYEKVGSSPFIYDGWKSGKKKVTMPYWLVPEEIMEDRDKIERWVRQSALISKKK